MVQVGSRMVTVYVLRFTVWRMDEVSGSDGRLQRRRANGVILIMVAETGTTESALSSRMDES